MNLRIVFVLPLLVLAGLVLWVDPGQPGGLRAAGPPAGADPDPSDREIQDVVYLGPPRPLLIRLRIRLGGRPYQEAWDNYVAGVFRYLDVNGDGVLSGDELDRIPQANDRALNSFILDVSGRIATPAKKPRTERWSRKDLADYYRKQGFEPFRIGGGGGGDVAGYYASIRLWDVGESDASADTVSKRLFELLDTNKDGKLSREELAAAPRLLSKLDTNEDETLSKREIMGQTDGGMNGITDVVNLAFVDGDVSGGGDSPFTPVTAGKSDPELAQKILARYGGGRKKLSREALPLDKATFDQLDVDGNGVLDSEELARFTARTPDLELRVRLGEGGSRPVVELVQQPGKLLPAGVRVSAQPHLERGGNGNGSAWAVVGSGTLAATRAAGNGNTRKSSEEVSSGLVLEIGNTRIELGGPAQQTRGGGWAYSIGSREQYIAQFKQADRDKNGYLDEKEAQAHPTFRGLFKAMDRDGDGKVFENEMLDYFEKIDGFRLGMAAASASLHFSDKASGLFELADSDGDGRLSLRELRNMVKLLDKLDTNGDGVLTWDELPRHYRAEIRPGSEGGSGWNERVFLVRSFSMSGRVTPLPERTAGPVWFRKMDRNQDGDVSRREFLGSDEEFRKIDTDGDGLISAAEATRADAWYRERRKK